MITSWSSNSALANLLFAQKPLIIHSEAKLFLCKEFHFFCLSLGYVDLLHLIARWSWPIAN